MYDLSKPYGIGVGEDTCLYINKDSATVYGNDGVWLLDSSDALFPVDTYFNAKDIKVTYLTEGDTLNLSTKVVKKLSQYASLLKSSEFLLTFCQVTSTKQLITNGTGSAIDSDDIFTGTEGIDSIKSLVSSSSSDSIGYSKENRPTARVVFYKGKGEKAYRSGQKYTVDKLIMDIGTM
jgi:cyanophycinase